MASLSSMFADFKSDQHDNFESLPDWYIENYDQLRGRMRVIQITSGNIFFESATRNSVKMMWYWVPNSEDPIKVTFETVHKEEDKVQAVKSKIQEWLKTCGYSKTHKDGKDQKMAINVADIDALLELFSEFNA